eukprot:m.111498 g.111498  ORF g.111498 m.111498 type:complete len:208 (-) comp22783_c0_seq1:175-798(-)
MLGLEKQSVHQCDEGWVPVFADKEQKLSVMSIGFLLKSSDDAVIWRGPKKTAMIGQFLSDVCWNDLDYLIVDTPPGTSDEHLSIVENLKAYKPDGAVLVTSPQGVSFADVRREADFCRKAKLPLLGLVENMSGFSCPCCGEVTNVFSSGGGEKLAEEFKCPFLGRLPIDTTLTQSLESGENFLEKHKESHVFSQVQELVQPLLELDK